MTTDDLIQIVEAGAGLSIDAQTKTQEALLQIVAAAVQADTTIRLRNAGGKNIEELLELARQGRESIHFEL
jgi:hypothetical protein